MRRALATWLALLVGLGPVATREASGEARTPYGGELAMSWFSAPLSADPAVGLAFAEVELARVLYDTPFRLNAAGEPEPSLVIASSRKSSRAMRLRIRPGVRFHDGTTMTAADLAQSIERAKSRPGGWVLAPIRSAKVISDEVVELTLTRKLPELPLLLSSPAAAVTPRGREPGRRPTGTGPYRLTGWTGPGSRSFTLEAFSDHFAGRPYLERIAVSSYDARQAEGADYETGAIGWSFRGAAAFPDRKPKHPTASFQSPAVATVFLAFGSDHPFLKDVELRRAIALAIDRDAVRMAAGGTAAVTAGDLAPPALTGDKPPPPPARDLAKAQQLLAAAAKRNLELADFLAKAGKLSIAVDATRLEDFDAALKVLDNLQGLGLDGKVERLEPRDFALRTAANHYDLVIGHAIAPAPDRALAAAAVLAGAGEGSRVRIELARAPLTMEKLRAIADERAAVVPLFHRAYQVHHLASLRGVARDPLARMTLAELSFAEVAALPVGKP